MTKAVNAIPAGYEGATPYLIVQEAARAVAFYERALGAKVLERLDGSHGMVMHAELQISRARVMLADEFPDMGFRSPASLGGSPVSMLIYVEDVDAAVERAVGAGCTLRRPVADQFYGDRAGTVEDPFGHVWTLASRKEDLTSAELQRRAAGLAAGP